MASHSISLEDVERAAALAHLSLAPERAAELRDELTAILEYVSQLEELDTHDVQATRHPLSPGTPLRDDVVNESLDRAEVLACAPASREGGFSVPKVLEVEK
jgi:aspartyl-tRNA(Asn)/glutamyl-tRNA(Gln) amidotransferase subunit C